MAAFIFGSTVGVLVQRSRWCNTAALRDAMLFKSYRNTKALLVAMMILTVGFTAMISFGNGNPMRFDVGINQFIGLFLFGIGMVFAGACTVSSWVKTGEGNIGALWALLFLIVGLFLSSLMWSFSYWPLAGQTMTGHSNAAGLQFGWADALTLQRDTGIPAIVFGLIQTAALYALYRRILRRERSTLAAEGKGEPVQGASLTSAAPVLAKSTDGNANVSAALPTLGE
ncbi:YeeE/YedE thiosulfate transporter family protein [Acidiferrobacter sp.]|uniref:YeeE/YedE thiosulfate transporter family protein n=1 Tax=Acidiferrobacter sp. TaxID=1872107 RepID=UPI00261A29B8|nr:YeeE/YedE thiosulfate transporter family protein [Acidiferrobacter sp.]